MTTPEKIEAGSLTNRTSEKDQVHTSISALMECIDKGILEMAVNISRRTASIRKGTRSESRA
jgi:hypothetical protein